MPYYTEKFNPSDALTTEDIVFLQNLGDDADYNSANVLVYQASTTVTIDGSNVDFVFASKPTIIVSDGASYRENKGWTWDSGTNTATMDIPPTYDLFGE